MRSRSCTKGYSDIARVIFHEQNKNKQTQEQRLEKEKGREGT